MSSDCLECGACCFSESSAYVPVFATDLQRLGEQATELTHVEDGKRYMKMVDGHCVALQRVNGTFACSIYTRRPEACQALARGSSACLEERLLKLRRAKRWMPGE